MVKALDLTGKKFGKLTVIERAECTDKVKSSQWICKCDCGNSSFKARGTRLNKGITTSCGCEGKKKLAQLRTTHGMRFTNIYHVWVSMKQRCNNPKSQGAKYYHEKGITYCDEWESFENFYNDMKDNYFEGAYIDRIDNSLGYYKENCRWVTVTESNKNRTNVKQV